MLSLYDMIDNDEIVYGTYRVHVIFLVGQLLSEIVLLSLTILAMSLTGQLWESTKWSESSLFLMNLVLSVIIVVLVVSAFIDVIRWYTKVIIVTDRRLIRREGFIQRNIIDITLNRLSQVDFVQSVTGRLFDYGNMTISGGADLPPQELRNISKPIEFRNIIEDARVGIPPAHRMIPKSVAQSMVVESDRTMPVVASVVDNKELLRVWEQFEDLHAQGFLTDAELTAKRRMLFDESPDSSKIQGTDGKNHDDDDGASAGAHSARSGDNS